jgi:hypothetical protein
VEKREWSWDWWGAGRGALGGSIAYTIGRFSAPVVKIVIK